MCIFPIGLGARDFVNGSCYARFLALQRLGVVALGRESTGEAPRVQDVPHARGLFFMARVRLAATLKGTPYPTTATRRFLPWLRSSERPSHDALWEGFFLLALGSGYCYN